MEWSLNYNPSSRNSGMGEGRAVLHWLAGWRRKALLYTEMWIGGRIIIHPVKWVESKREGLIPPNEKCRVEERMSYCTEWSRGMEEGEVKSSQWDLGRVEIDHIPLYETSGMKESYSISWELKSGWEAHTWQSETRGMEVVKSYSSPWK